MRRMIIPAALAAPLLALALGFALPVVVHAGSNGCTITGPSIRSTAPRT